MKFIFSKKSLFLTYLSINREYLDLLCHGYPQFTDQKKAVEFIS